MAPTNGFPPPEYMILYFTNAWAFKRYFKKSDEWEKRRILRDIYALHEGNHELNHYLSEKYPKLVKEVGRDVITHNW